MSKKTPFLALALACAIAVPALGAAPAAAQDSTPRIDTRQANQLERIGKNLIRGRLSIIEAMELLEGQQRIYRMERRAVKDGFVSRKERRKIEKAQDRQSKRIARFARGGDRYAWSNPDYYDWRDR